MMQQTLGKSAGTLPREPKKWR